MERMEELCAKVAADPLASIALAAFGLAVLRLLTLWKTERRLAFPVVVSGFVYWYQTGAPTLLDAIHEALKPREYLSEGAVYLLRELAGFLLVAALSTA